MTPPSAAAATARHRSGVRRGVAPHAPRRVSGPARPRAHAGGAVALPPNPSLGFLRRAGALADARVLDRLLTGRVWIGFVAFALIGIVFMQVSLLKLNAGMGVSVQKAQSLERVNADLRAEVSSLGSNDRIQQVAEGLGLELPPPGAVTFLGKNGRRTGGDGVTQLAVGTQTAAVPATTVAGATTTVPAPTPAPAATAPQPATTAPAPAPAPAAAAAGAAPQTTAQPATPAPTPLATAAGGATPQGG